MMCQADASRKNLIAGPASPAAPPEDWLVGGGEMGAMIRAVDWAQTPLEALARWSQSLRTAVGMVLDAQIAMAILWGPEHRLLYNDRYRALIGAKHPEALGRPATEVFSEVWDVAGPEIARAMRGESVAIDDWSLTLERRGYPEPCWFSVSISPIRDERGEVPGLLSIAVETTAQIEGRRRLAELHETVSLLDATLGSVPVGLCFYDRGLGIVRMNATLAQWNGIDREHVVGRRLDEVMPASSYERLAPHIREVFETGRTSEPVTIDRAPLNLPGRRQWLVRFFPVLAASGEVTQVGTVSIDITDQVRARHDLASVVEYSEKFTAMLGHDLRNPLNAITTAAQLLERRATTPEIKRPARRIVFSVERMSRMIAQLLDLARVRVTGLQLHMGDLDLGELCQQVLDELRQGQPGAQIYLQVAGALRGRWDGDRLAQVISNIAGNALEHGEPGAPVRVELDGTDVDRVALRVENRGAIPDDVLPTLFDPFRGARHRGEATRGLGLGLYISKEIVEAHGGAIEVRSSREAGTLFEIDLPRDAEAPR